MENTDIDMDVVIQEWTRAKQYIDYHTVDFKDLDNIVDGVPITHEKSAPYVGDTTLAGLVRSIPRSSIQQLPVFSVQINGTKNSVESQVATFLLRRKIFNEDTFGKGLLSTLQIGAEQALTHGYAPFMVATGSMYNDFGTTMKLLHFADAALEPGVQDANESSFFYVRANLTKSRLRKVLKSALANPETSWNVEALQELLSTDPQNSTADYLRYLPESRNNIAFNQQNNTYEIVTRYEVGQGGDFVTFSPAITDKALRVIPNKSKFGYPRVQFLVIDPASLTPFGVSRVRLASPNQNLSNAYYQNVTSMLILNSKPPLMKRGRFSSPVQLKQGVVWEALDQNSSVDLKEMSNSTLEHFVPMMQQMASQIQNIMGSPTGTVNGDSNSFGFSKTAPGVKMQQNYMDSSTNQVTKILENFLRQYALSALDTYISEQTGDTILILDDEAKDEINRLAPNSVGDDNKITITWEDFYANVEDLVISMDLSISEDQLDDKERGDIQDTITVLAQNAAALGPQAQVQVRALIDKLTEEVVPDVDKAVDNQMQQQQAQPMASQPTQASQVMTSQ